MNGCTVAQSVPQANNRERWNRTGAEIADMLGVSAETISNYVNQGAPKIAHDEYDERAFIPWVIALHKSRDTASLAGEQARLTKNKADLAEIELAEKRNEVVPVSYVRQEWDRVSGIIRAKALTLSSKTDRIVGQPTMRESQKVLDDAIWNILDELSRARVVSAAESTTPSEVDGQPVGRHKADAQLRVKRRPRTVGNRKRRVPARHHGRGKRPAK